MESNVQKSKDIPTLVKDEDLVRTKRQQIVDAAVRLFCEKGYHQTTTREIARAAGISIGALYEYIASKEDVLYLTCDAIHTEMAARMRDGSSEGATARETLIGAIGNFFRACDHMQDSILLIYQETNSLAPESMKYVLRNDARITRGFEILIAQGREDGSLHVAGPAAVPLMAHNIVVMGHMWAFRRWFLARHYTLDEYIAVQTALIMNELGGGGAAASRRQSLHGEQGA